MKKFYSFLVAAVVLMVATSCQKEAVENGFVGENMEFTASIASGRTELGGDNGRKVMWNSGDNIRIFTQQNAAGNKFSGDAEAATATAKFTTTENFAASENGYLAVYPETANTGNATYADGVWSIPVNMQGWNGNPMNFPFTYEKNALMAAFSNDNQLSFNAATAMLKIKNIDNSGAGTIKLLGANLGGEATLHYDTNNAENPISYTLGSGDSQVDYNFPEQNGETIYVPIYPGTVTGFEVYGDDWQNPLVTYNKTITFKAGVIYDLDLENAPIGGEEEDTRPVSPWQLYNIDMEAPVEMRIDGDYHVATLMQSGAYAIMNQEGTERYGFAGEFNPNTWYKTGAYDGSTFNAAYIMAYDNYPVEIYMTEDAAWFCAVTMENEMPVQPAASAWCVRGDHNNWGNDGVPTTPMYDMGDYSVAYGVQLAANQTFKFEHGGTWVGGNGTPTVGEWNHTGGSNIQISETGIYDVYCMKSDAGYLLMKTGSYNEIPSYIFPVKENCLYLKPTGWWLNDNAWFAAYFCNGTKEAIWVKANPAGFGGYYEIELPGTTAEYKNVIFCRMDSSKNELDWGSKWNQTGDLTWSAENNAVEIANDAIVGDWYKITEY